MENPFEIINTRLSNIEKLLVELLGRSANLMPDNKPMNIKEAAAFINRPVSTIYNLVSKQSIPHSRKGKRLYFTKEDLIEWVKSGDVKTVDQLQMEAANILTKSKK